MLRTTFLAKIVGAFALGHLLRKREPQSEYGIRYEHDPDTEPRWIVRLGHMPTAQEAASWRARGFTHCSWPDGDASAWTDRAHITEPLSAFSARF